MNIKENIVYTTIIYITEFCNINMIEENEIKEVLNEDFTLFLNNLNNDSNIQEAYQNVCIEQNKSRGSVEKEWSNSMKVCQYFANNFYDIFNKKDHIINQIFEKYNKKYDIYLLFMNIFKYFHHFPEHYPKAPEFRKALW